MCIRDSACFLAAALLLFCFCILRGYKIPSPGLPGWLALGLGGGYFLVRAWFSPWFYYESVADLGLIATAIVMFAAGTYAGAGNGEKSILPVLAAALGLLNALLWGYQNITGTEAGCTPIFPRSFSPEPTSPILPTTNTHKPPATTAMPGWG